MSGDKRSVATDALETLGTIIDDTAGRDAIHLAVEPAIAGMTLRPGEDVGLQPDGTVGVCNKPLGIVDPFLKAPVKTGERFWLVVYPRQITSLRHVWEHPAFPVKEAPQPIANLRSATDVATSEAWLQDFCAKADCPGYADVMNLIMGNDNGMGDFIRDEYMHFDGRDAHGEIPDEFWDHVEVVTGRKFKERATFFSCSC
jgi:hypothetical protein